MLERQCSAWGSVVAAAVHVPLVGGAVVSAELAALNGSTLGEAAAMLHEFHARMEAGGRCAYVRVCVCM